MAAVIRAFFGYTFLIFIVRLVGRRPGKQLTPFEFVLVFFMGGLTLTAMIGTDASFTNAICEIITVALTHFALAWLRAKSPRFARLTDGTPLILFEKGQWRSETLEGKAIQEEDVLASARESSIPLLENIDTAVLERNGEINVIPQRKNRS
jgi:uncharacterized membrane protein YcaP (DUF421 family)